MIPNVTCSLMKRDEGTESRSAVKLTGLAEVLNAAWV